MTMRSGRKRPAVAVVEDVLVFGRQNGATSSRRVSRETRESLGSEGPEKKDGGSVFIMEKGVMKRKSARLSRSVSTITIADSDEESVCVDDVKTESDQLDRSGEDRESVEEVITERQELDGEDSNPQEAYEDRFCNVSPQAKRENGSLKLQDVGLIATKLNGPLRPVKISYDLNARSKLVDQSPGNLELGSSQVGFARRKHIRLIPKLKTDTACAIGGLSLSPSGRSSTDSTRWSGSSVSSDFDETIKSDDDTFDDEGI